MKTAYCVNLMDNINNLIALRYYKPEEVVIIDHSREKLNTLSFFKDYLVEQGFKVNVISLDLLGSNNWSNLLGSIDKDQNLFILPSSDSIYGYQLLLQLQSQVLQLVSVEDDGDIYTLNNGQFVFVEDCTDIDVEDYIEVRGGYIKSDSSDFFEQDKVNQLLSFITTNYDAYINLFRKAQARKHFIRTYEFYPNKITFSSQNLSKNESNQLSSFISFFVNNGIASIRENTDSKTTLIFDDRQFKSYLLITGTWLEHKLYQLLKQLGMDDLKASLSFIWNEKNKSRNECDMVGIKDNQLILASCKDTNDIKPYQINEIYTNTTHLGNEDAIKILFTTNSPSFNIKEKAKEFNVHIIRYTFSDNSTIKELKHLFSYFS